MRVVVGADSAGQPLLAVIATNLANKTDVVVTD